jgi:hypothetical protein
VNRDKLSGVGPERAGDAAAVNKKAAAKVLVDAVMLILLLLTMAYHSLDYKVHEWLGISLLALFAAHNLLGAGWYRALFKGRYTAVRIFYTAVNSMLDVVMIIALTTGILDSIWVFRFLDLDPGKLVWKLHLSSGVLGFLLTAVHLGLHWGPVAALFRGRTARSAARFAAGLVSVYGVYAAIAHKLGPKILMLARHTGLDFTQPFVFFAADHIAVMCLFACIGHYAVKLMRRSRG